MSLIITPVSLRVNGRKVITDKKKLYETPVIKLLFIALLLVFTRKLIAKFTAIPWYDFSKKALNGYNYFNVPQMPAFLTKSFKSLSGS